MSEEKSEIGAVSWMDLTVEKAEELRDFYSAVVGWESDDVDMDGYNDFCMIGSDSDLAVAGICHKRGTNADLPAQWIIYITVANLDYSIASCKKLGGQVIAGPSDLTADSRYCIIKDPAGAVAALYEKKSY